MQGTGTTTKANTTRTIVKVQKPFRQARNAVKDRLDCKGVKRRQLGGGEVKQNVMIHNRHERVRSVEPNWHLCIGDNEHVPHPRRIGKHRPHGAQQLPMLAKFVAEVANGLLARVDSQLHQPYRVGSVDPRIDNVDGALDWGHD